MQRSLYFLGAAEDAEFMLVLSEVIKIQHWQCLPTPELSLSTAPPSCTSDPTFKSLSGRE